MKPIYYERLFRTWKLGAQEPGDCSCRPQTQVALEHPKSLLYPQPTGPESCPPYPAPAQAPVTQSQELRGNNNNSYNQ